MIIRQSLKTSLPLGNLMQRLIHFKFIPMKRDNYFKGIIPRGIAKVRYVTNDYKSPSQADTLLVYAY
jgi:hypothetical protein